MGGRDARGPVVVVDDQMLVRRGIERAIERTHAVRSCASYDEAVQTLDAMDAPPHALILDVNLGGHRDGLDVGEYAYERFTTQIPTLVMTGSQYVPEISERAMRMRAELLVKPQPPEIINLFLERIAVRERWGAPDVLDLDREMIALTSELQLTKSQTALLFTLLKAAETGERPEVNANTRKAGLRRILRRTGHATFEELRRELKNRAVRRRDIIAPSR